MHWLDEKEKNLFNIFYYRGEERKAALNSYKNNNRYTSVISIRVPDLFVTRLYHEKVDQYIK